MRWIDTKTCKLLGHTIRLCGRNPLPYMGLKIKGIFCLTCHVLSVMLQKKLKQHELVLKLRQRDSLWWTDTESVRKSVFHKHRLCLSMTSEDQSKQKWLWRTTLCIISKRIIKMRLKAKTQSIILTGHKNGPTAIGAKYISHFKSCKLVSSEKYYCNCER